MTTIHHLLRLCASAALAATLGACTTTPPAAPPAPKLQDLLSEASQAAAGGNKEKAVTLWKQGAAVAPADKTPWSHIAQTRYEAGQYGDAILAAQEVLVRDPNDKLANSIIAISGLRLSTRALGDLSRQNNLSGSLRTESQDLAKLLRESLGETVLVPPPPPPRDVASRPTRTAKKAAARNASDDDASADPFRALK